MRQNIFLEIEYDGTNYFGFQIQPGKGFTTVQEVLEEALKKLFQEKIRVFSSGRTDRGVHAKAHPLNFITGKKIPLMKIKKALNSFLPSDVRVRKAKKVSLDFHSRFWAESKIYRYLILNQKEPSVFWRNFSWHFSGNLNLSLMRRAALKVTGKKNFSFLAKDAGKYESCVRNLKKITIQKKKGFIYIDLEANGFLRQMARNIVFLLTQVGAGRIDSAGIDDFFSGKRDNTKCPAPAQGLYLYKVKYGTKLL